MLQANSKFFNFFQRVMDVLIITLTWLIVYFLRFKYFDGSPGPLLIFEKAGVILAVVSAIIFSREGLYLSYRLGSRQREIIRVLRANLLSVVTFIVILYLVSNHRLSRAVMGTYTLISTLALISFRMLVRNFLRSLRARGRNLRTFLLIGNGWMLEEFVKSIQSSLDAGVRFGGWLDSKGLSQKFSIPEWKGTLQEARVKYNPDQIVIGYPGEEGKKVQEILKTHFNDVIPITVLPDLSYSFVGYKVDFVAGLPALILNQPDFSDTDLMFKRIFDFIACGVGLLVLLPLLVILAILVKITSPGPIFFSQERIGLDGKKFKMWKFRSMKVSAEQESTWTVENDPRRTKLGTFLRKTSLDELPQLWNVLCGDMSLVGPRPEQPRFVDKFRHEIPAYMLRHKMKAGITGWAQVNGWRGDTSLNERIACDIYYIKNWSFWLDMKILFLTFWKALGSGY